MNKRNFNNLVASIQEAGRIQRGEAKPSRQFIYRPADVRAIRRKLGKSQSEFAHLIGVRLATLQNWEQGRRTPVGPARALLQVAAVDPEAVRKALTEWRSLTPRRRASQR